MAERRPYSWSHGLICLHLQESTFRSPRMLALPAFLCNHSTSYSELWVEETFYNRKYHPKNSIEQYILNYTEQEQCPFGNCNFKVIRVLLRKESMTLLTFLLKNRWKHITNKLPPSRATPHSRTATSALQQWDKEQLGPQPPSLRSWQLFYHCEPVTGGQWCQEAEIEAFLLSHKAERALCCTMRCQKVHQQDGEIPLTSCKAHHLVLTFTRSAGKGFSFPCLATWPPPPSSGHSI